jgi:hypothetical protein
MGSIEDIAISQYFIRGSHDTYSSLDISGTLVIWAGEHRDNTDEDSLDSMNGRPTFACLLVSVLVLTRGMLEYLKRKVIGVRSQRQCIFFQNVSVESWRRHITCRSPR